MRYLVRLSLLAGTYFAAGRLGQLLAIPPGNVSVVWPSSGIALAALLLWGNRLWPGIWLGSLLVNVRTVFDPTLAPSLIASLAVGAMIATGSTAQALAGRRLIDLLTGGHYFLDKARAIFLFAAGAVVMCLIGSTVGTTSLCAGGLVPWSAYGFTWRTWWLGDAAGVIVVAPLLLAWLQQQYGTRGAGGRIESIVFLVLLLAVSQFLFGSWLPSGRHSAPAYLAFPLLIWAAFRFGQRGATMAVLIMTAMAILGITRGAGQFQDVALHEDLWMLQTFGGVLAVSTLALAAVVAERKQIEDVLKDCNRTLEQRVAERTALAEQRAKELSQSEAAFREQARTLRSILDNILEGIIVADPRGKFLLWNSSAERILGVSRKDIAMEEWPSYFGCFLADQVTPYAPERLPLARALRGETVRGDEMFLSNPSRPEGVWLSLTAVPLPEGDGEAVGGVVVFRDISETKLAELRLGSIIESVLAGIVVVNEGGRITLVNRQAELIFGYTREELCGQPIEILIHEPLGQDHRRYVEGYLRDPQCRPMAASRDIHGLRKDGQTIDLEVALNPFRQDGRLFVLASILDVTEQRRASDLTKSVVEFSPDGSIMVDRDGRIVLVNRETERMFGYAREELLGQPLDILVPERVRHHHHHLCLQFVAERRRRSMNEGRDLYARRKDGSEFPADISLHSHERNGEHFAIASIRDMTERHRLLEAVETNLLIQKTISRILQTSLEPIGLDEHLDQTLDLILSVPWFANRAMCGIYLVEEGTQALVLKAQRDLLPELRDRGAVVARGSCHCGNAAGHRDTVFADGIDERHHSQDPGQPPHHLYCVPIVADDRHYGVIDVFFNDLHDSSRAEEESFLSSVARVLAGVIERRRAEEALRLSEARFRAITEAAPLGIFLTDTEGDFLYTNRAYLELAGRCAEEPLGKGWKDIIHTEDRDRVFTEWYRAVQSRSAYEQICRYVRRDGRVIWVSVRSGEVRAGDTLTGFVGIVEDITKKREASEALCQSEERFDLAVRGTDAGIWDWDLHSGTIYFSPRWKSMLGYDQGEIGNDFSEWESRLHPDDRARAGKAIQDYLEGLSAEYELEHRLRHKDGSYRWILSRGAAVRDREGLPYRMVGSHLDITDHKQTVEQLSDHVVQLRAAQRIQQSLLPKGPPILTGLDIAGIAYPATFAGGDLFDYLPLLGGHLGIVIGDVSGHGIGAALLMASTQAYLRSLAQTCATIGEILTRVNQFVFEKTEGDSFVTLMLIRIDPRTRMLTFANAGHPHGYVLDPAGNVRMELHSSNVPLGIMESVDFPVAEPIVVCPGELIVLVTDGILEEPSPEGTFFGSERMLHVIRSARDRSSEDILEELHRAVRCYSHTDVSRDDLTAVVVKIER